MKRFRFRFGSGSGECFFLSSDAAAAQMARSFIYKSKDTVRASKMLNTELNAGTQITRCELIEGSGKGLGSSPPELTLQHLPQGAIWHSGGNAAPTPMAKRIGTRLPCTNLLRRVGQCSRSLNRLRMNATPFLSSQCGRNALWHGP